MGLIILLLQMKYNNYLNEILTCSICKELFSSEGNKVPLILNCGHTFC